MYGIYDQQYYPHEFCATGIPRSYFYPASDGSDAGSSGGGGTIGSDSLTSLSTNQIEGLNYERSQENTPFSPSHSVVAPVQSSTGFTFPPESFELPATFHSATPELGGDAQTFGGQPVQYPQYHGSSGMGYDLPQQSFATFGTSPQAGSHRGHQHQHQQHSRIETTSSSPPTGSLGYGTPMGLQIHGINVPTYPDAGDYLRHQLGLPPDVPINLGCLPDPPPGRKPSQAYPLLIKLAIYGSPQRRLTLQGIYEAIENRFEYFRKESRGAWKRSIRHNLSLNQVFRSSPRAITEPGKGSYWELDVSKGEGYKRERKRNKKARRLPQGQGSESESASVDEDEFSDNSSVGQPEPPSRIGYSEVGPSRTAHVASLSRRTSPYPQGEAVSVRISAPVRPFSAEVAGTTPPHGWSTAPLGQAAQGYYHQPQPCRTAPVPLSVTGQGSMFRPGPFAQTMAWHAQQQQMRPASVSSQLSYTPSLSSAPSLSAMSASHGHAHAPLGSSIPPRTYGTAFQGPQSAGGVPYQGFGQEQMRGQPEQYDTETQAVPLQRSNGGNPEHRG
ncbi:hypothetical protein APHAL10511_007854 [Amanita phalloides]|nr:hypothetical protein APHAL10511_007854 [Amanita phalloides]